jgi:phosphatidylglycerophosphate synthase
MAARTWRGPVRVGYRHQSPKAWIRAQMLDRLAVTRLKPALDAIAVQAVRVGIAADTVTWLGFVVGISGAGAIAMGESLWGLALLLASRLADGLDGAIARATRPTHRGAFLDITLDFVFYASVPLAFAIADPARNALPAAVLLASFIGTGSSFLAFAVLAERQGLKNAVLPSKGFYYLGGLTEATETLICFACMCLWPQHFAWWAYGFAALCGLTTATRVIGGARRLGGSGVDPQA